MSKKIIIIDEKSEIGLKITIANTITYLEKLIDNHKENPIDKFLQKEICRLKEEYKKIKKNGKSN